MNNVKTKLPISLEVAYAFMEGIRCNAGELFLDTEFSNRFNALQDYINGLLNTGFNTDIVDMYVIYEQQSP